MTLIGALLVAGAAALQAQGAPLRTGTASMSVGATVVRPPPAPAIAIARGAVTVGNAEGVTVTAEGGIVRRIASGTLVIAADGAAPVRITLTY